jgi:acetyl esterase
MPLHAHYCSPDEQSNIMSGRIKHSMRVAVRVAAAGAVLFATDVLGAPPVQDACNKVAAQPLKIEGATTRIYKTVAGADLRLHIFNPGNFRPSDKRAAVIFFFGGGWIEGEVEQFVPQSKYLASRGMVAVVADYRVRCRHNSTPLDSIADARAAILWTRSHAATLGIDPKRIGAGGGSAGGHIALCTSVFDEQAGADGAAASSAKPNALVLFNPVIDMTSKTRPEWALGLGLTSDQVENISPLQHVHRGLPPTLILSGKADKTTPYSVAEKYCFEAAGMGNECHLVGFDGAGHGFFNVKWYRQTLLETDRFLTSIGYLPQPAPSEIP